MAILWCGGEDIDFPNGGAVSLSTSATFFRSGWARCSLGGNTVAVSFRSNTFPGGGVTSCWFSFRAFFNARNINAAIKPIIGLVKAGTTSGIYFGVGANPGTKLMLIKFDGTTPTQLAAEVGTSIGNAVIQRYDMQIINFGPSATINIYQDGILLLSAVNVDASITGVSTLDQVCVIETVSYVCYGSEFIVSDTDTRSLPGLVTLALTGAGTTNAWTNPTFSNINGTTLSDLNPTSSNTNAQDNQYNVTDLPAGTFAILAVKSTIRAAASATPAVTKVKMGVNSGGSVAFGAGAAKTPAGAYTSYEQIDSVNPATGNPFLQSEMNALQLDFQSAT